MKCTGPKCSRPTYAEGLCRAHHRQHCRHPGRPLKPLRKKGEPLVLSSDEAAALLKVGKRLRLTVVELAQKIAAVGVRQTRA